MFSRNCELFEEVSALCTRCTDLKNNKPSDMSRRSILNSNYLAYVFGPQHGELQTMNECRNQSVKCVMKLHDPLAGGNEEESARWFLRLLETLLTREKDSFRKYVGNTVLNLSTPMDFCVHVEEKSTAVVIFYIDSLLQKLAKEFFRNESQSTSIVQALQILHNPSTEHQAFRDRAYDLHEGAMNYGQMRNTKESLVYDNS